MNFLIASSFTDSLAKLTAQEQKAVKTAAFDLQMNPANPGMQFHRVEHAKDPNFWSVRVSSDLRLIVHRTGNNLMLCYVDHHDDAYDWARRRRLETHPTTGAAQLVEIHETVKDVIIPHYVEAEAVAEPKPALFADVEKEELLGYGVPPTWLKDVFDATEDTILDIADHLPEEAAEALLELAVGGTPQVAEPVGAEVDPFDHPDAQRRFRVMTNVEELERALEYPWEKWTVFLHPAQRQWVERDYSGPARVSGSAGTGKTIVALHRAVFLARAHSDARVLLTTFSESLANALRTKLRRLIGNEPRLGERLEVHSMDAIGRRLYELNVEKLHIASREIVRQAIEEASDAAENNRFSLRFLLTEWEQVVDAWQLTSWEEYRDVLRLGRKTRLPETHRVVLWSIFDHVRDSLHQQGLVTHSEIFSRLAEKLSEHKHPPFGFVVVDEAQDITVSQLRFLAAIGADRPNALFFAGDLGQRIFQQPFSWKTLGVDIRGRSRTLRVNYRTSHQIRTQADRLLDPEIADVDGNIEERRGTVSVFNGPKPTILSLSTFDEEKEFVSQWLRERTDEGLMPHEIGVFVRSTRELNRAKRAVEAAKLPYRVLDENVETVSGYASISTMHLAKGLEFRAVVVMACDDEIIPSQERIETVADDADLEEVYNTERHLLYVACTRARDHLLVTSVDPPSEFLDDLQM
jgi:mRNA-degrading endonuclease RelE of RelBE toxin-antitoxin system